MKNYKLVILGIFFSIIFILPFFSISEGTFYLIQGDDYPFHMGRIFSTIQEIKQMNFFSSTTFFGEKELLYGANIFYPTLTTVLPISLLYFFTHSVVNATYSYIVLINILTFAISYRAAHYLIPLTIKDKPAIFYIRSAFLFAFLYLFSAYRFLCIYERFDLGEFFSLSMYPLIFAGFYSIFFDKNRKGYWLAIGMSLLVYSHILSLFLCAIILILLYIVLLFNKQVTWKLTLSFLKEAALAVFLSAFSLFPLLNEMLTLGIRSVKTHVLQKEAYNPLLVLASSSINYLGYMSMGLLLLVTQLFILISFFRKGKKSILYKNKLLFFCSISSLLLTLGLTTLFPWFIIQYTPLVMIQFPFRLMAFITVFSLYICSILFTQWSFKKGTLSKRKYVGFILVIVVLSFGSIFGLKIERSNLRTMVSDQDIISSKRYQKSVNKDYFPKSITSEESKNIVGKIGYVNGVKTLMDYSSDKRYFTLKLTDETNTVITPIISYSSIELYDQNGHKLPQNDSTSKTISVELPKGEYTIYIKERWTTLKTFSFIVSLLATGFVIIEWRKSKTKQKNDLRL